MANNRQHAVVVGGGIVGNLTAYLLASQGLKVPVIEADAPSANLETSKGREYLIRFWILACGVTRDIKVCRLSCMPPPV